MKEVFREYGGMIVAAMSTTSFLIIMGCIFFSQGGVFCRMISLWGNSGI